MELNEIPTPISDAARIHHFGGVVDIGVSQDLERHLAAAMRWVYACEVENQNRADMIASYENLTAPKP